MLLPHINVGAPIETQSRRAMLLRERATASAGCERALYNSALQLLFALS